MPVLRNRAIPGLIGAAMIVVQGDVGSACAQATCGSSNGPDVIVGDIGSFSKYGTVSGVSGYAFGTTACNFGTATLTWIADSDRHPVIAMHAYRLKGGRFEQIGMSWVKHGWGADTNNFCCSCIDPFEFEALGIGCSDTYDAGTNAIQGGFMNNGHLVSGLGPRSEINTTDGSFFWPYIWQGVSGNAVYKRLQIKISDLDPAQNSGAQYFAEAQYVTSDDAVTHGLNNASYRRFTVGSMSSGSYSLNLSGAMPTHQQVPAIQAWIDSDPLVTLRSIDVAGDGRFNLGYKITDNGNGTWHYEYALHNYNSHRSAGSFSIPIPFGVSITNIGYHDVDYHSGEPYDLADWTSAVARGSITWSTVPFAVDNDANALRWGTTYNFRFDANAPPHAVSATIGLFRPGIPGSITAAARGPARLGDVNGNGYVNVDDLLAVINGWGRCPALPILCPADIAPPPNGNGFVNVDDLLLVINNWG